jgi:Reverse transcriptase (RNA-dependent DNA polymerase)
LEEFKVTALYEVRTLEKRSTWVEVLETDVPTVKKLLGGTWVFKRKQETSGNNTRHRARYCVRGDQQIAGMDYFKSYAPVVAWTSVRMSLISKLEVVKVDYTNAFNQSTLYEEVYVCIPIGFEKPGHVKAPLVFVRTCTSSFDFL